MQAQELFEQVKELIANKDLAGAKDFVTEHKDELGSYFEQAKGLLESTEGINGVLDKVKGLFGK